MEAARFPAAAKTARHPPSRRASADASGSSHPSALTTFVTCRGSKSAALAATTRARSSHGFRFFRDAASSSPAPFRVGPVSSAVLASRSNSPRATGSFFSASAIVATCIASTSPFAASAATRRANARGALGGVASATSAFRLCFAYPFKTRAQSSASKADGASFAIAAPTSRHAFFVTSAPANSGTRASTWKDAAGPPPELAVASE